MERRQFIAGSAIAALSITALPIAAASANVDRSEWERALRRYTEAEAAADRHYKQVYEALAEKMDRMEDAAGLDRARFGFWERRKAFININPNLYRDYHAAADECERHGEAVSDALGEFMDTPAPDLAALNWKLGQLRDADDGSLVGWSSEFIAQTFEDIARLLPPAA